MTKNNIYYCGECCFFTHESIDGIGGCSLKDYVPMHCSDLCDLDHTAMRKDCLLRGLHYLQKWRRSNNDKIKMPPPYVVGVLIDSSIHYIRKRCE